MTTSTGRSPDTRPWATAAAAAAAGMLGPMAGGEGGEAAASPPPWAAPSAPCVSLAGEVAAGEAFERAFGDGLVFRLEPNEKAPPNPPGWTIEVRSASGGAHDFVWPATPPYRFMNPRYLDTSHGTSAAAAVEMSVRRFGFVTSEDRFERLARAVRVLTFSRPPDVSPEAFAARRDSMRVRWSALMDSVGRGELRITDAEVSHPTDGLPNGRIERLAFEVTLCPDGSDPSAAGRDGPASSRPAPTREVTGAGAIPVAPTRPPRTAGPDGARAMAVVGVVVGVDVLPMTAGVTTVRDMDGRRRNLEYCEAAEAGRVAGPRVYTAGAVLEGEDPFWDDTRLVATPAAACRFGRPIPSRYLPPGTDACRVRVY